MLGFSRLIPVRFIFFFNSCKLYFAVISLLSVMLFSMSKFSYCLGIYFVETVVLFDDSIRLLDGFCGGSLYYVEFRAYLVLLLGGTWVFISLFWE